MTGRYIQAITTAFNEGHSIVILDGFPKAELAAALDVFEEIVDEESFFTQYVGEEFGKSWAVKQLQHCLEPGTHLLTLAQFMRLRKYFNEELFAEKAVIETPQFPRALEFHSGVVQNH